MVARTRIGRSQNVYWSQPEHVFAVARVTHNNTPRADLDGLTPTEMTFGRTTGKAGKEAEMASRTTAAAATAEAVEEVAEAAAEAAAETAAATKKLRGVLAVAITCIGRNQYPLWA